MAHSPEPWKPDDWLGIVDAEGCPVASSRMFDPQICPISCFVKDKQGEQRMEPDDIIRIIACVNACKGIPLDVLMLRDDKKPTYTADGLLKIPILSYGDAYKRQRDERLAKSIVATTQGDLPSGQQKEQ